jgi:hypothetical protein
MELVADIYAEIIGRREKLLEAEALETSGESNASLARKLALRAQLRSLGSNHV